MEHLLQKSKCSNFHNIFKMHDIVKASKGVIMEYSIKKSDDFCKSNFSKAI